MFTLLNSAVLLVSVSFTVVLDVEDCPSDRESRRDSVLIDSLFIMDQFKAAERMSLGKSNTKDITEVTAVAEAILPKGSARVTTSVRKAFSASQQASQKLLEKAVHAVFRFCKSLGTVSRFGLGENVPISHDLTGLSVTIGEVQRTVFAIWCSSRLSEDRP